MTQNQENMAKMAIRMNLNKNQAVYMPETITIMAKSVNMFEGAFIRKACTCQELFDYIKDVIVKAEMSSPDGNGLKTFPIG